MGSTAGRRVGPIFVMPKGPLQVATDGEIDYFERERDREWTVEQLERVRSCALALVRSHRPIDLPNGELVAGFSGAALWSLLSALDRVDER